MIQSELFKELLKKYEIAVKIGLQLSEIYNTSDKAYKALDEEIGDYKVKWIHAGVKQVGK